MVPANRRPFPVMLIAEMALILLTPLAASQNNSPNSDGPYGGGYTVRISPAVASLVVAFICGFFFLGFFSVYLRNCGSRGDGTRPSGNAEAGTAAHRNARRGLDAELLASFPTMAYAEAKKHDRGKGALECAVCLSEFADDDRLRLLPGCCHVFHVDCIDAWLDTHATCPVCRANLADPAAAATAAACEPMSAVNPAATEEPDLEAGHSPVEYRRWHSTGHEGEVVDRHTLRLPDHVRREIFTAALLRRAASVAETRLRREASTRRGYRGGRNGRWGFLLRTFSVRRRADGAAGEGFSKRIFPASDPPLGLGEKPESSSAKSQVESGREKKKANSSSEVAREEESSSAKSVDSQVTIERV